MYPPEKMSLVGTSGGVHGGGHGENRPTLVRSHGGAQSLGKRYCSILQKLGAAAGSGDSRDGISLCGCKITVGKWNGGARDA